MSYSGSESPSSPSQTSPLLRDCTRKTLRVSSAKTNRREMRSKNGKKFLVLIWFSNQPKPKMLTKTSIISLLMLITFSFGGEGLADGSAKAAEIWSPRTPSRLQSRRVTFHSFILNGTPADIEDYPFKVSLRISGMFICGASVIGSQWVLTAGHCMEWRVSPELVRHK